MRTNGEKDLAGAVRESLRGPEAGGIVSVYLFGSRAAGREHRESDVDLGVLFDRNVHRSSRDRFEARLRLFSLVGEALSGLTPDLVVLNDAPPELARKIVTEGRRLFCPDPAADHAFVRDIQLRAADLAPFLRRKRAVKLEAIVR